MTKQKWLDLARLRRDALLSAITRYHPASPERGDTQLLPITAAAPEAACEAFRQEIASDVRNPVERFNTALVVGDVAELMTVMDETWLGVPESTACWTVTGFPDLVNLLDDPPEEEGGQ